MSGMAGTKDIIVCDLDGTLALDHHRAHHLRKIPRDWDTYFSMCAEDSPNFAVIAVYTALAQRGYKMLIVTGRRDDYRKQTEEWLARHYIHYSDLIMRPRDNRVDDHILKRLMVTKFFNRILLVLEDRQRVVDMWRKEGLTCLQVAPGDF